jgi:hypothetical protein
MPAFWDAASFIVVEVARRFRGAYCLHHQGGNLTLRAFTNTELLGARAGTLNLINGEHGAGNSSHVTPPTYSTSCLRISIICLRNT